ncbi:MBL fold metallo-hydrolase [Nocardioides coralli]|uniref:MBL fold metallo-hydrolase n=1 Tax=Nocardioides coralli TaxID=2872154 RepID=UPI001CA394C0|nr:MBL fold metallo-hydrolase [Nocardioides coralli]QZY29597.1 MBL fold metallo-hydrolase [Nocardioides coralli]
MGLVPHLLIERRSLLRVAGGGAVGFAILGTAACGDDAAEPTEDAASPTEESPEPTEEPTVEPLSWERVDLGFVAAYVLVRGEEAAVVDTGVEGSAPAIATVLDDAGPGWAGVRHVVLTHKHPDHIGSTSAVLTEASGATGYAGEADLTAIDADLQPLGDGEEVFGLQVVATPGHTAGHLSVFDPDTGVLVAGDALANQAQLSGSIPQFTEDEAAAAESVRKLAALTPSTILVGHGPPVTDGAADALQALADSL